MRKTFTRLAIGATAAIAMLLPTAASASAGELPATDLCYVMIVIDKQPDVWVGPGGAGVETGEYHYEQNCVHIDPRTSL